MILFKVQFGRSGGIHRDERENLIHEYLASMFHSGQAYGEYYICLNRGTLNAYVPLAGKDAFERKYHSPWGRKALRKIVKSFGKIPEWQPLEDQVPCHNNTWLGAPFLYFFTNALDLESPVCRGDNGSHIPAHILPLMFEEQHRLYAWRANYREYDSIWLDSGILEKPVYKQLSDPMSELALEGRALCRRIEKKTKIPTYDYLKHFSLNEKNVRRARCPACGFHWKRSGQADNPNVFFSFDFQCRRCRLVAHL